MSSVRYSEWIVQWVTANTELIRNTNIVEKQAKITLNKIGWNTSKCLKHLEKPRYEIKILHLTTKGSSFWKNCWTRSVGSSTNRLGTTIGSTEPSVSSPANQITIPSIISPTILPVQWRTWSSVVDPDTIFLYPYPDPIFLWVLDPDPVMDPNLTWPAKSSGFSSGSDPKYSLSRF
jgi:hypothetical protein